MVAILHPVGPGPQIPVDRAVVLIGRSPECDVILDCSSKISRVHCALVQVDAEYYVRDLGSLNGVWVAGKRIEKEARLSNGTEVAVGDVKFLFLENVAIQPKGRSVARSVSPGPAPGRAPLNDEVEVVEAVEVADDATFRSPPARPAGKASAGSDRMPKLSLESPAPAEIVEDVELIEDVQIIDGDIVEDVELVEDLELIDNVEIIDDIEIIEDVEVIDDPPRRDRNRRR